MHRFGDNAVDLHICPRQLPQQLVETMPDGAMDLKVRRFLPLETLRAQEHVSYMELRFPEYISLNVAQCHTFVC